MEKSVKQRIDTFIKSSGLSQAKFERSIGVSNGYLNNLKKSPSAEVIQKILSVYPSLDHQWLLSGEGKMLNDTPTNYIGKGDNNSQSVNINDVQDDISKEIINDLRLQLQEKDRQLAEKDKQIYQLIAKIK